MTIAARTQIALWRDISPAFPEDLADCLDSSIGLAGLPPCMGAVSYL